MDGKDLLALQSESVLGMVNRILLSGEFAPAPEKDVEEGETVIGELTLFEKAIFSARKSVADTNNARSEVYVGLILGFLSDEGKFDRTKMKEYRDQAILDRETHKALDSLLWASLRQRLGASLNGNSGRGFGIKTGYKVVSLPEKDSLGDILLGLQRMVEAKAGGMSPADDEEHDCGICPVYEGCDLPHKTPRV